ncbi:MAG: zinc metalloprotease HtpX, partial [Planctomycetota bacterium]
MGNIVKTYILLGILTGLFIGIGNLLGGAQGAITGLVIAAIMNFISYYFSDKIVLSMYRAQYVNESEAPELYSIVKELTQKAQIPLPKIYIIPLEAPNAFATGRNPAHSAVAVTQGLLRILDTRELRGVLAHEISHIKNRDILVGTIAATLAGAIMFIVRMFFWFGAGSRDERRNGNPVIGLLFLIFAPLAATLIQLAISRSREYLADYSGGKLSGDPLALANALRKLETWAKQIPIPANPGTS